MMRTVRWSAFRFVCFTRSNAPRKVGGLSMDKSFVFIALLWAFQAFAQGTYTASSCSQAAVQAAITAEQAHPLDGDTISIPAGSCTWTTGMNLTFNNSVVIQGAGATSATNGGAGTTGSDVTAITNHAGSGNPIMEVHTVAGKSFRFTGVAVLEDGSSGSQGTGNLVIDGQSSAVRVDHCHFLIYIGGSKGLGLQNGVTGVADHLYINTSQEITNDFAFLNGGNWQGDSDPNSLGNQSWVDADHFGTSKFFYVEDSRFSGGYLSDCSNGGRWVLRYSTVLENHGSANHGTHDPWRSCRAAEIYQNTFTNSSYTEGGGITHNNGGSTLIWGNAVTANFAHIIDLNNIRDSGATYSESAPPNGWGYCNTSSGTVWDGKSGPGGYPCLDQPARGAGDLLAGYPASSILNVTAGNTRTWPHQVLDPIYAWANTLGGSMATSIVGDNTNGLVADNRDYFQQFGTYGESGSFNGTAGVGQGLLSARPSTCSNATYPGPGYWATDRNTLYVCTAANTWTAYYTPFTYPHPLTQSSTGSAVAAPTNLSATVN